MHSPLRASWFAPARETWIAAAVFAVVTVVFTYPLSLHPLTLQFPGGPDVVLGWYLLGWDTHAFLHRPWDIFNANIYYPEPLTLAYGENVIGLSFMAAPVIWLTGNLLLAHNVVCLVTSALCGVAAYILCRRHGLSFGASLIAGIVFECAAPRFLRTGQIVLSAIEWIPLTLAALHLYLRDGRSRDLKLAAAFITIEALSSGHGAVFIAVTVAAFCGYRVLMGEPIRPLQRVRDLGITGILLLLPGVLVFVPYLIVQRDVGLRRGLGTWVSNYSAFFATPSQIDRWILAPVTSGMAPPVAVLFPGFLALGLSVVGIFAPRDHDRSAGRTSLVPFLSFSATCAAAIASLATIGTLVRRAGTDTMVAPRTALIAWGIWFALLIAGEFAERAVAARHRPGLRLTASLAAAWCVMALVRPLMAAGDGLNAQYFLNATWSGSPDQGGADPVPSTAAIMTRWGGPDQRLWPKTFSIIWTGYLTVPADDLYTFTTTSDDGSTLIVDNALVVDNSGEHGPQSRSGRIHLRRGAHRLELRFVEIGSGWQLQWTWARAGGSPTEVPPWLLSRRRGSYAVALAARALDVLTLVAAVLLFAAVTRYIWLVRRTQPTADWMFRRRRDISTFYTVLLAISVGLALGPPYGWWPYVYWLPGFNMIRVSSRFSLLGMVALPVLAAVGFDVLARKLSPRGRTTAAVLVALLLIGEYVAIPIAVEQRTYDVPALDRWLDTQPKPFVVAEMPIGRQENLGEFDQYESAYMIHSSAHWQPTIHGYSGWRSQFHVKLFADLATFPDDKSLGRLDDLRVTYVVVHADWYPPDQRADVMQRIDRYSARLRPVHRDETGVVYALVR